MCSSPLKINSPPFLIFKKVYIYKDSDAIFNYSETSRTHLTLIVFLAEIVDVFLQFNLWEKITWCILCSPSPLVVYFVFFCHLSTNKMWNKIYLYCYFPQDDPLLLCVLKFKRGLASESSVICFSQWPMGRHSARDRKMRDSCHPPYKHHWEQLDRFRSDCVHLKENYILATLTFLSLNLPPCLFLEAEHKWAPPKIMRSQESKGNLSGLSMHFSLYSLVLTCQKMKSSDFNIS